MIRSHLLSSSTLIVVAWACTPACNSPIAGGQTGSGSDFTEDDDLAAVDVDDGHELDAAGLPECETVAEPIADSSHQTALGFSADDVLAFAAQRFNSDVAWSEGYEPSGTSDLALTLEYRDGDINYHRAAEGDAGVVPCVPFVTVVVEVEIETGDGALDESFDAVLKASSLDLASFRGSVLAEERGGGLALASGEISELQISGFVSPRGSFGQVDVVPAGAGRPPPDEAADAVSLAPPSARAGYWPAESCAELETGISAPGILVEGDAEIEGVNLSDAVSAFERGFPVPLQWESGEASELEVSVSSPTSACLSGDSAGGWALLGRAPIEFLTTDSRLEGALQADLRADHSLVGGLGYFSLSVWLEASTEEFVDSVRLDQSLDRYSELSFAMSLGFEPGLEQIVGSLHIAGEARETDCAAEPPPDDPRGSELAECPDQTSILGGHLGEEKLLGHEQ